MIYQLFPPHFAWFSIDYMLNLNMFLISHFSLYLMVENYFTGFYFLQHDYLKIAQQSKNILVYKFKPESLSTVQVRLVDVV